MKYIIGPIAWVYDFLAEDMVLLIGTVLTLLIVLAAIHVHSVKNAAGIILFVAVVLVIFASLWRTVSTSA